jgi:hypothetical protein
MQWSACRQDLKRPPPQAEKGQDAPGEDDQERTRAAQADRAEPSKEITAGTKPSIDFIKKILDDAYESDMTYDVTDLRSRITVFAANSSNQAQVSEDGHAR